MSYFFKKGSNCKKLGTDAGLYLKATYVDADLGAEICGSDLGGMDPGAELGFRNKFYCPTKYLSKFSIYQYLYLYLYTKEAKFQPKVSSGRLASHSVSFPVSSCLSLRLLSGVELPLTPSPFRCRVAITEDWR